MNTIPAFKPPPIHAIHDPIERRKSVNDHGRTRNAGLAAHGLIVHLDCLMRAGFMMFARPVMAAVTVLVLVVAVIPWSGVIGMPLLSIALASSEKMGRARKMLANLQPSATSGRDNES